MHPHAVHAHPHQVGVGNLALDDDLYFNQEYFDPGTNNQADLYGQMDLPGFSPRLARLSGGSSGFSLSGGMSGFLGSGGSNELWSLGSGAAQQQQQQQQQYNVGAGMGNGSGGMMMGGYPGHMQPSMPSQVGTQGTVVMGHQAPPPLVHHNVTSTPSPGTDGEHRDSDPGPCCSGPVMVSLYHRTRTAKGWSLISANDEVRVTKDRGKVIKLRAECKCAFAKEDIEVDLIDLKAVRADNTKDGIQVVSMSMPQQVTLPNGEQVTGIDIEVKLSKICKLLQFRVAINSGNYCACVGTSVEFTTHNSGTKPVTASKSSPTSSSQRVPTAPGQSPAGAASSSSSSTPPRPQFVPGARAFPATPPPPPPKQQLHHSQQGFQPEPRPVPQAPSSQQHHQQHPYQQMHQKPQQQQYHQQPPIGASGLTHSSSPSSYSSPMSDYMQMTDMSGAKKRKIEESAVVPPELMNAVASRGRGETVVVNGGLDVEGIVRADAFLQYSDVRLKTEIEDIVDALDIIAQIDGHRYRWKADNPKFPERGGEMAIGLIAQEVQKVLPEAVVVDEEGYLSVAYAELIPVLIAAFKQHLESYQNNKEEFKKEFEAIRGELRDKSNRLSTKEELNILTRQMNCLITTVNNHKNNQDIEKGEPHVRAEAERKKKRRRRLLIGGAILLGLLLLVVVVICIVVPVAVLAGGSSSSSSNGNANGNKNGNSAARSLRAYSDQGGTGWSEAVTQHDRGERGGGIGTTAASASTTAPTAGSTASERRSKEPAVRWTAGRHPTDTHS